MTLVRVLHGGQLWPELEGQGSARGAGGCRRSLACSCSVVYVRKKN
jgi:hypothetical protein